MVRNRVQFFGIFATVLIAVLTAANGPAHARIGNGIKIPGAHEVVKIKHNDKTCTGVIVGPNHVLTSITCYAPMSPGTEIFKHGSFELETADGTKELPFIAAEILDRENADPKLVLAKWSFEDRVIAERLSLRKYPPNIGNECSMIGFGELDPDAWFFDRKGSKRSAHAVVSDLNEFIQFKGALKSQVVGPKRIFLGMFGETIQPSSDEFRWGDDPSGQNGFAAEGDQGGVVHCYNGKSFYTAGIIHSFEKTSDGNLTNVIPLTSHAIRKRLETVNNY